MTGEKATVPEKRKLGSLPSKRLVPGERIVWEGRPTWIIFLLRPGVLLFLSIVLAILMTLIAGRASSMLADYILVLIFSFVVLALMVFTDHHRMGILLSIVSMVILFVVFFDDALILLAIVPPLLGALAFGVYYLIWAHISFALTDRRIISQYGIFSLRYADTQINRVQNVTVVQPWYERIMGYGDVAFATAGEQGGVDYSRPGLKLNADGTLIWEDVPKPFELRRRVEEILYQNPAAATAQSATAPPLMAATPPSDVESRLLQLKQMKDKGLINDAEYEAKRKEIINRF